MSLETTVQDTMKKIESAISADLSEEDAKKIAQLMEKALTESVRTTAQRCTDTATLCCGPDADKAHKIAEEIKRERIALISNLNSLR